MLMAMFAAAMPGRAAKQYDAGVPANQGREDDAASARLINQGSYNNAITYSINY